MTINAAYCPRPLRECQGACRPAGCAICPRCSRLFFLEPGQHPGALCCICKAYDVYGREQRFRDVNTEKEKA